MPKIVNRHGLVLFEIFVNLVVNCVHFVIIEGMHFNEQKIYKMECMLKIQKKRYSTKEIIRRIV